jgi:small subunit ribosomal protein S10
MKFRLFFRSFDNGFIQSASEQFLFLLNKNECKISGIISLPIKIKRFCVLRSPHVDKDSREHFELRLYKRFLDIETTSPSILDSLLRMELPSGVSCSLKILSP